MSIIYQVTISPAENEKLFNITWFNQENREEKSFTQPAADITAEELERLWQNPQFQLEMGRKLYRFLDGSSRDRREWLQALEPADFGAFAIVQFALVNMVLAVIWLAVAIMIGRRYRYLLANNVFNAAPELTRQIPDLTAPPGAEVRHRLDDDQFIDKDPGDLLTYSAQLASGAPLPSWMIFEAATLTFRGRVPDDASGFMEIEVVAKDIEGLSAAGSFFLYHAAEA